MAGSEKQSDYKKILTRVSTVLVTAVFLISLIALGAMLFQVGTGKQPNLFGYRFFVVVTDSMTPSLRPGDVLISKITDLNPDSAGEIEVGAVITYTAVYGDNAGMSITHRVTEKAHYDEELDRWVFTTQGDKIGSAPDAPVPVESVDAVLTRRSGFLTGLYRFFTSSAGMITLLAVPLGFIIVSLVFRMINIIRTPAEKAEEPLSPEQRKLREKEIADKAVADYIELERRKKEIAEKAVADYIAAQNSPPPSDLPPK